MEKRTGVPEGAQAPTASGVPGAAEPAADAARGIPALPPEAPVFLFSGQGAQKPGMGADVADVPEVARALACASDVFGFDVAALMAHADERELSDTRHAQPALCALSVGLARALMARGVAPSAVLGFSLGQVSALAISGMLSDEATFALAKARSELMAQAAEERPGGMSALLKADAESVQALCAEQAQGDVLVPANYNCPGQVVVAGTHAALARAEAAWEAQGGRFSRLATSGAFHSPLMASAAEGLRAYLEGVEFAPAEIPLVCNVDARPLEPEQARDHLVRHLTSPVLFQQSVLALAAAGARTFAEVGFGGVLASLVRRIDRGAARACIQDRASLEAFCAEHAASRAPQGAQGE